ncbi:small metal-binding protein SmbP [Methylocystis sp. ATCC 49242]|uniref:small metal-binding protein SmbP n=1 Tax=Methylocystis sp. ATCC 49242 TaxID=622637 RepID=UPI0001F87E74|nr:small metal-binding protein SmbP [Methylocystis sp. ATCC 49242]
MKHWSAAAVIGFFVAFSPICAQAGVGVHVEAAMEHAREAIEDGAKGDAEEILVHVSSALGHAREALHEKAVEMDRAANKLLHNAIRHLRKAEMRARFGDVASATKHSVDALTELKKIR